MVRAGQGWNNPETESNKQNWIQVSVRSDLLSICLYKSAGEVERCGKIEGSGSQGNAFSVFVLLVTWDLMLQKGQFSFFVRFFSSESFPVPLAVSSVVVN